MRRELKVYRLHEVASYFVKKNLMRRELKDHVIASFILNK